VEKMLLHVDENEKELRVVPQRGERREKEKERENEWKKKRKLQPAAEFRRGLMRPRVHTHHPTTLGIAKPYVRTSRNRKRAAAQCRYS